MKIKKAFLFWIIFLSFFLVRPVLAVEVKGNDLEVIMDCSNSMSQPFGSLSKIEAVKKAIFAAVQSVPDKKYFGLRAFGHRTLLDNKKAGCQDSELLIPVGPVSKDTAALKIKNLAARGGAPIAYALKQTRSDFSTNPEFGKVVVLISDGNDNCDDDPCAAVKEMKSSGFNLIVNTIGLGSSQEAESQLRCIAEASGGEFTKVYSSEELEKSLSVIFGKVYSQIRSSQNIEPGNSFTEAPMAQAGKFVGLLLPGDIKYYKVNVKQGQDVMATLSFKREVALDATKSKETLGSCGWIQPSIKIYDQFQTLITGFTPGAESDKIVKDQGIDFKSYFANWKAETSGDIYVAFSSQWLKACPTSSMTQFREEYKKGLYELNVAIEGTETKESAVTVNETVPKDQAVQLSGSNPSGVEVAVQKNKASTIFWLLLLALMIILGIGGGGFYLLRKKGFFGNKTSQGSSLEHYDSNSGNLTDLSEKQLMETGSVSSSQEYFKPTVAKPVGQTGQIKLNDQASAYITCPGCQAKNLFGSRIFISCGKNL